MGFLKRNTRKLIRYDLGKPILICDRAKTRNMLKQKYANWFENEKAIISLFERLGYTLPISISLKEKNIQSAYGWSGDTFSCYNKDDKHFSMEFFYHENEPLHIHINDTNMNTAVYHFSDNNMLILKSKKINNYQFESFQEYFKVTINFEYNCFFQIKTGSCITDLYFSSIEKYMRTISKSDSVDHIYEDLISKFPLLKDIFFSVAYYENGEWSKRPKI